MCGGSGRSRAGWSVAVVLALGVIASFGTETARAQGPARQPMPRQPVQRQPGPGQPAGNLAPGELQQLFDAYALVQAQEMLRLDDEQYGRFVSRLKALQEARRRAQVDRQRLIGDLVRLSNQQNPEADDATLRARLGELDAHEERSAAEIRAAYAQVDDLLDLRQRARFRAFEQQMERRRLDLLLRAGQPARRGR